MSGSEPDKKERVEEEHFKQMVEQVPRFCDGGRER